MRSGKPTSCKKTVWCSDVWWDVEMQCNDNGEMWCGAVTRVEICTSNVTTVLQSTTGYYSVLQSTRKYYKVLPSTRKYSTTNYYKGITTYYKVFLGTTKHCKVPLRNTWNVDAKYTGTTTFMFDSQWKSQHMNPLVYNAVTNRRSLSTSASQNISPATNPSSPNAARARKSDTPNQQMLRPPRKVTRQHQMLRLPRKVTLRFAPQIPLRNAVCIKKQNALRLYQNFTQCCPCHEKWPSNIHAALGKKSDILPHHQMIREWTGHLAPACWSRLLVALCRTASGRIQHFALRLPTQISPSGAPATKSDSPTASATKSKTATSPNGRLPGQVTLQRHHMLRLPGKIKCDVWCEMRCEWCGEMRVVSDMCDVSDVRDAPCEMWVMWDVSDASDVWCEMWVIRVMCGVRCEWCEWCKWCEWGEWCKMWVMWWDVVVWKLRNLEVSMQSITKYWSAW